MDSNYICKVCGNAPPVVFALSTRSEKTPLCTDDIGKFLAEYGVGLSIFPIAAYSFVESLSDMLTYEHRTKETHRWEAMLDEFAAAEESEFQQAVIRLKECSENVIASVLERVAVARMKLSEIHERMRTKLNIARQEVEIAKVRKSVTFSETTISLISESTENRTKTMKYSDSVNKSENRIIDAIKQSFAFQSIDLPGFSKREQLFRVIRKTNESNADNTPNTDPKALKRCIKCTSILNNSNYQRLSDHPACDVCLDCIMWDYTGGEGACPVCGLPYNKCSKQVLRKALPKMQEKADSCRKKHKVECASCLANCENALKHVCSGGKVRCEGCFSRFLASTCYQKPIICLDCSKSPTESKYYNLTEKRKCSICSTQIHLNEISHWCRAVNYFVCGNCISECDCFDPR